MSLVIDNMLDVVFRFDATNVCTFVSPSLERVLGYESARVVGTDTLHLVHPDDVPKLVADMQDTRATPTVAFARVNERLEIRLRHAVSGAYVWGEAARRLQVDGDGHFAGAVVAWRDISKRKLAEAKLIEAESRYREVVDAAREVVFQLDVTGAWQFLSPSWKEVTGYEVAEGVGRNYLEFVHPEDREATRAAAQSVLNQQRPSIRELTRIRTKEGKTRWVEISASLSRDRGGHVTGGAGTIDDVTQRFVSDALAEIGRTTDRCVLEGADVDSMAQRVCEALVASLRHPAAWVELVSDDGSMRTAGHAGRPMAQSQLGHVTIVPLPGPLTALGTLCIGTDDTGDIDADHLRALASLAGRLSTALQLAQHQKVLALQAAAMASSANALFITDPNGRIEWVNSAFEQMSGYAAAEAIGRRPSVISSGLQAPETFTEMWKIVSAGGTWRGEIVNRRKDAAIYIVSQTVTPLFDDHHVLTHLVAAHEDITARRAVEARVSHMAEHDALTDLPNRAILHERLAFALAQRHEPLALLFLDLDRFKLVNDTLGHAAGDELLRAVAGRLRECVREHDIVARQGGDEFIVLLSSVASRAVAMRSAQRILESLGRPLSVDGHDVHVTASIGVAMSPEDAGDAESLIKHADAAMYRAKQAGRNGVVSYSADFDDAASSGLTIHAGLARALSRGELSLQYQPQVDVASKRMVGLEALLRWTSPELGRVSPADFIPVAEETGLIVDIDRWVLRAACAQHKAWAAEGLEAPRVAVNLSGVSFRHGELVATVEETLRSAQLAPEHLEIELTEGIVMHDASKVIKTLDDFRKMGVRVALDDFGTGYSSLSYLKRFKIDALKIDRSFVSGLPDSTDDAAIARLIVSMANVLGMSTIAEGVETHEQARFLESVGCTTIQGYLYSRPIVPEAVSEMLRQKVTFPIVRAAGDERR